MGVGRAGAPLLWMGAVILAVAVAAGSLAMLGLALLPLGLCAAAALAPGARLTGATFELDPPRATVGQDVHVTARLQVAGRGPLRLRVHLPDAFRLVRHSNVATAWAAGRGEVVLRFTAACDRRGVEAVGPAEALLPSRWLLGAPRQARAGAPVALRVDPAASRLRRWPDLRARARSPMAEMDLSPTGLLTTHFQDIRHYVRGDPHRSINWKASARRGELAGPAQLFVNDYEREGRRQVWIFLDARDDRVGTSLDNGLERRIEATLALASAYLRRGFSLGLTLYNHEPAGTPYPDASGRQARRILELLAGLPAPAGPAPGLAEAVKSVRGHLHRAKTVAFVVTTLDGTEADGLRVLRGMVARRRGRPPVAVIHVDPLGLLPEAGRNDLARTVSALERPRLEAVRGLGVRAVRWDPSKQGLSALVRRLGS